MKRLLFTNLIMAILIIAAYSAGTDLPVTAVAADSYFVSPGGSDFNPGTEEKPWETIQKAAESAAPGSTVYIKEGTYYERIEVKVSGASAEEPIVFRNFDSDRVIIDGSKSSASEQKDLIHILNRSFVTLSGLEITGNTDDGKDGMIAGIGVWGKSEGVVIRDCKISHIWYTGTSKKSGAQAIAVYGRYGEEPISGLVIDGNEIWDIKCGESQAVALSGNVDGFIFTNNYVHDTDNSGLAFIGDEMVGGEPVCPVSANNRARNGFVGYNTMERNSRASNPSYRKDDYSAGSICVNGAKDVTIAYNTCTENDIGIEVGNETTNNITGGILVRDNLIFGNSACGIRAGSNSIKSAWVANCRFLNNTLYGNDTKNLKKGEIHITKSHDLQFSSNIVYTGPQNLAVSTDTLLGEYIDNISFDHNLYYGPGGSRGLRFTGVGTGLVGLNMWRNKTGQDKHSQIADPKFADPAAGDFRLKQHSPAIDFGDPAYLPEEDETDFAGAPRVSGKAIDSGIYEF